MQCIRCYTKYTPGAAAAPFVTVPFQYSQMIFTLGKSQNPPPQAGAAGAAILPQQEGCTPQETHPKASADCTALPVSSKGPKVTRT